MGEKYQRRHGWCPTADCDWTDFEPVDVLDGTFMFGQSADTLPLQTLATPIIERGTFD
jgi:hypothetical protein